MSQCHKGYYGRYGLYYPAESCHIPLSPDSSYMLINKPRPQTPWATRGGRIHLQIKNFQIHNRITGNAPIVTLGGYMYNIKFAIRLHAFTAYYVLSSTSSISNRPYIDYFLKESQYDDLEVLWQHGMLTVKVNKEVVLNERCEGDAETTDYNGGYETMFSVHRSQYISYDFVDGTFDDGQGYKCHFVPMRTADGLHHAILESSTRTIVEI